jgi:tetratricopeptide (TPR) repeat protein
MDWEELYRKGEVLWDRGGPSPPMKQFLERHALSGRALIPGCGRGHEVALALEHGLDATGLDIAPTAIAEARAQYPHLAERFMVGNLFDPPAEALPYLHEAMAAGKQFLDPKDSRLQHKKWLLAYLTTQAGKWEEAKTLWAEAAGQCERDLGADNPMTAQFLKGQAHLFLRLDRADDARQILERAVPIYHRALPTNHNNGLDAEGLLAQAYEKLDRLDDSAKLYDSLSVRWEEHLPSISARDKYDDIVSFFIRHRRYEQAKAAYRILNRSFEKNPPARSEDFETMIAAAAAIKGWCAASEVCRKYGDQFSDDSASWPSRASIALYCGDASFYRQLVTNSLAVAGGRTNTIELRRIGELVSLGPVKLRAELSQNYDSLLRSIERALATAPPNEDLWHRTIAAMQFRRGHFEESLSHLEMALKVQKPDLDRARLLLLKAMALQALSRTGEALIAFNEARALMEGKLSDRLIEREGFLNHDERSYLVLQREAQELIARK